MIRARLEPGLGRVGVPDEVSAIPLRALLDAGVVPVVSPVSDCPDGKPVNINADEAALGLARALGASSLIYLSDVDGVRVNDRPVAALDADAAYALIADGTIAGGMALKVRVALAAAAAGIPEVVIAGRARLEGMFPGTRIGAAKAGKEAEA
jgi:acetylglutamate kinase